MEKEKLGKMWTPALEAACGGCSWGKQGDCLKRHNNVETEPKILWLVSAKVYQQNLRGNCMFLHNIKKIIADQVLMPKLALATQE